MSVKDELVKLKHAMETCAYVAGGVTTSLSVIAYKLIDVIETADEHEKCRNIDEASRFLIIDLHNAIVDVAANNPRLTDDVKRNLIKLDTSKYTEYSKCLQHLSDLCKLCKMSLNGDCKIRNVDGSIV